ncbi:hypothetical protein MASR1M59_09870 [Melaminivora sp.]
MTDFAHLQLPAEPTVLAPDGSQVRVLLSLAGASMAHFQLPAGAVAKAVVHRSVEELWFIVSGHGQMWRRQPDGREQVLDLQPGLSLSIPVGTQFQFRADQAASLAAVAITMPPWPGMQEAQPVTGPWEATV